MKGSKTKKAKDLAPKSAGSVKGGLIRRPQGNDNITLIRAVKPATKKKDLPARKDVKGGLKKL